MKRVFLGLILFLCGTAASFSPGASPGDIRASLLPKLQAGQTLRYEVHARLQRRVKTESRVVTLLQSPDLQRDLSASLLLTVKDVRIENGRQAIDARVELRPAEEDVIGGGKSQPAPKVEFTLSGDGKVTKVDGLDGLDAEQRFVWQSWLARFAFSWTLPAGGVKPGNKWKSEEPELTPAPIANLLWERETTYAQDEPCPLIPDETCGSFYTRAMLKQKSPAKDTTPEDYRLQDLKTSGTAQGTNEIITYISLRSGLMLRATEDVRQSMDVTILKADGSNGVHYTIDVTSHFETMFSPSTTPANP